MTISSESISAGPFSGDGSTTVRAFTFKCLSEEDIEAVLTDAAGDSETTLALTTDYSVVLNSDQDLNPGGSLTTTGASSPHAIGEELNISNKPLFKQLIGLLAGGPWSPKIVEGALDRLTILAKRAYEYAQSALNLIVTESSFTVSYAFECEAGVIFYDGWTPPENVTVTNIEIFCVSAPVGAKLTIDCLVDGDEQSRTASLDSSSNYQSTNITNLPILATERFGLKIKTVGATESGNGMIVTIRYKKT